MARPIVLYDARFLQPKTRHWGVGIVIRNVVERLADDFNFIGLSHHFPDAGHKIKYWPSIPRVNRLLFEVSMLWARECDLYWGTTHFLPGLLNRPSVLTVHDMLLLNHVEDGRFALFLSQRFRSSLARATKIVADSRTTADDLAARLPELKPKIEVALLGYEAPELRSDDAAGFSPSPYMLMLGCHRPRKNLELALATVSGLRERGAGVQLLITGDVHRCFRRLLRQRPEGVLELGVLPKPELFRLLKGATCLLFPSKYEGFGLPLLEAMAVGCPVLALDIPINQEIAGDAARLLPNDPAKWAAAIKELATSRTMATEMREKGYQNLRRFSWEKTAAAYREIFHAAAGVGSVPTASAIPP